MDDDTSQPEASLGDDLKLEDFTVTFDETKGLEVYRGSVETGTRVWSIAPTEIQSLYEFLGQHVRQPAGIG